MPTIIVETPDGDRHEVNAAVGRALMTVLRDRSFDIEGTCDGSLACATCHVVVDADWYGKLPSVTAEEQDMLDFTEGLTSTSRLSCQIPVTEALEGLRVKLPAVD